MAAYCKLPVSGELGTSQAPETPPGPTGSPDARQSIVNEDETSRRLGSWPGPVGFRELEWSRQPLLSRLRDPSGIRPGRNELREEMTGSKEPRQRGPGGRRGRGGRARGLLGVVVPPEPKSRAGGTDLNAGPGLRGGCRRRTDGRADGWTNGGRSAGSSGLGGGAAASAQAALYPGETRRRHPAPPGPTGLPPPHSPAYKRRGSRPTRPADLLRTTTTIARSSRPPFPPIDPALPLGEPPAHHASLPSPLAAPAARHPPGPRPSPELIGRRPSGAPRSPIGRRRTKAEAVGGADWLGGTSIRGPPPPSACGVTDKRGAGRSDADWAPSLGSSTLADWPPPDKGGGGSRGRLAGRRVNHGAPPPSSCGVADKMVGGEKNGPRAAWRSSAAPRRPEGPKTVLGPPHSLPPPPLPTVLMWVRARVRPLPPALAPGPNGGGGGKEEDQEEEEEDEEDEEHPEPLRLQLSVSPERPGVGQFRLALRGPGPGPRPELEWPLESLTYTVRGPREHVLQPPGPPGPLSITFAEAHEAQRWWTVVSSSAREARRAAADAAAPPAPEAGPPRTPGDPSEKGGEEGGRRVVREGPEGRAGGPGRDPAPGSPTAAENLAAQLARAIAAGDEEAAVGAAAALAQQRVPLCVRLRESCFPAGAISLQVGVEDASSSAHITLSVHAHDTIATLQQQVFEEYGFPPRVQRWVIGRCLCVAERSLGSYGVQRDGDQAFLYLLSNPEARSARPARPAPRPGPTADPSPAPPPAGSSWGPDGAGLPAGKMNMEEISHLLSRELRLPGGSAPPVPNRAPTAPSQPGWPCPSCTFINTLSRPGCEMCGTERPRPEDGGARKPRQAPGPGPLSSGSLDDFIHLSSEFC
ncbi:sharpin [Tachyglossus aculeatus]|uniref:sharpin n=1 Tax=Tachyglossus aculeatus TaxID=9261 RepID=UPI0018F6B50B|nr:sharpin [Tachyglossus aculeatus]